MERQIPLYFDSVIVDSPIQEISENNPNMGRLKVRVFTKYGNRNGSYITDQVAEQLIESATSGSTPVVGFFDPSSDNWASHTGPSLANGYGYVENFLGWEPFTDTDGVTRDYAVFSVVLFTEYFGEAKKIIGQNQSMELDAASISGDWAVIDDNEYFVYTSARILGLCVIGSHEPCFSVSAFFSKNDNEYKTQYEKFSALLEDLRMQVEKYMNNDKGGEQPMESFENNPEMIEPENIDPTPEAEPEQEAPAEPAVEAEPAPEENLTVGRDEFDKLNETYKGIVAEYENLQHQFADLEQIKAGLEADLATLQKMNDEINAALAVYQKKEHDELISELFEKYEKIMSAEEIAPLREQIDNYTYEELESKLAIAYARAQISNNNNSTKVPLPEPQESQFALLMKKYRKN